MLDKKGWTTGPDDIPPDASRLHHVRLVMQRSWTGNLETILPKAVIVLVGIELFRLGVGLIHELWALVQWVWRWF